MATTKKTDLPAEEESNLYDFDDLPSTESTSAARIETPGITHNLKATAAHINGKYKDKETSEEKTWEAFELTLTDDNNLEFRETYFSPPQKVEDVKYMQKKYGMVDGKVTELREASPQETLKILNNEFFAYLKDLGTAFGYKESDIIEHLKRNGTSFTTTSKAFIDKFKLPEAKRISAKILYNNKKKAQTSFLKIHGDWPVYHPYGNDLFDAYIPGKPTALKLNRWEETNGMVKMYTGQADAPKTGDAVDKTGYKPIVTKDLEDFL